MFSIARLVALSWMRMMSLHSLTGGADTYNMGLAHNLELFVRPDDQKVLEAFRAQGSDVARVHLADELQNAVQFSIVRSRGDIIRPENLPLELKDFIVEKPRRGPARKLDAAMVKAALAKTGGNKAKAAKLLGVGRATLYRFLGSQPQR